MTQPYAGRHPIMDPAAPASYARESQESARNSQALTHPQASHVGSPLPTERMSKLPGTVRVQGLRPPNRFRGPHSNGLSSSACASDKWYAQCKTSSLQRKASIPTKTTSCRYHETITTAAANAAALHHSASWHRSSSQHGVQMRRHRNTVTPISPTSDSGSRRRRRRCSRLRGPAAKLVKPRA